MLSRYVTDIVLDFLKVAYSQKMFHFDSKKAAKSLSSALFNQRESPRVRDLAHFLEIGIKVKNFLRLSHL